MGNKYRGKGKNPSIHYGDFVYRRINKAIRCINKYQLKKNSKRHKQKCKQTRKHRSLDKCKINQKLGEIISRIYQGENALNT